MSSGQRNSWWFEASMLALILLVSLINGAADASSAAQGGAEVQTTRDSPGGHELREVAPGK